MLPRRKAVHKAYCRDRHRNLAQVRTRDLAAALVLHREYTSGLDILAA
jgi:hypothetical protein